MAVMAAEQESDRAVLDAQWRGELRKLRNTQRHSYQQWIDEAYKEMTSLGGWGFQGSDTTQCVDLCQHVSDVIITSQTQPRALTLSGTRGELVMIA